MKRLYAKEISGASHWQIYAPIVAVLIGILMVAVYVVWQCKYYLQPNDPLTRKTIELHVTTKNPLYGLNVDLRKNKLHQREEEIYIAKMVHKNRCTQRQRIRGLQAIRRMKQQKEIYQNRSKSVNSFERVNPEGNLNPPHLANTHGAKDILNDYRKAVSSMATEIMAILSSSSEEPSSSSSSMSSSDVSDIDD